MLILLETMAEERRTATAPELLEPLMARLAGGDQEALAELYHRTRTSVYGLALSYLKNRHDAEDVTQDAFVRAWENAHQYRPQGTPLAWLLTIARNLALMKLRERGRTQDMALEDWERLAAENPMVTVEDRQVLDAALTGGVEYPALSDQLDQALSGTELTGLSEQELADRVAGKLAEELLAAKFLQGIPLAGAVGGVLDSRLTARLLDYAALKYTRRFLLDHRPAGAAGL